MHRTTLRLLSWIACAALFLAVAAVIAATVVVPRAMGATVLTVKTGSMTPTIPVGSVVVVRPVDPNMLRAGDVITYQREPGQAVFITHRVLEVNLATEPPTVTAKGDANPGVDDPVPFGAIRGKVAYHVSHVGTVRSLVGSGIGVILATAGLALYAIWQLVAAGADDLPIEGHARALGWRCPPRIAADAVAVDVDEVGERRVGVGMAPGGHRERTCEKDHDARLTHRPSSARARTRERADRRTDPRPGRRPAPA